jgi:hypothetical protein
VWHVVIALAAGRIAKVECKQCGARHRYRPSAGEGGTTARTRNSGPRAASTTARGRKTKPIVEADPSRPRRPFRTNETYQVGDRVLHPSFGEGVVQAVTGATKIEILFDAGSKILVHGRGGERASSRLK